VGVDGAVRFNLCMAPLSGLGDEAGLMSRLMHNGQ
jgi:hypothetical protein